MEINDNNIPPWKSSLSLPKIIFSFTTLIISLLLNVGALGSSVNASVLSPQSPNDELLAGAL